MKKEPKFGSFLLVIFDNERAEICFKTVRNAVVKNVI